jgi:hypothetical protein
MATYENKIKPALSVMVNKMKALFGYLATEDLAYYITTEDDKKLYVEPIAGGGVYTNKPKI